MTDSPTGTEDLLTLIAFCRAAAQEDRPCPLKAKAAADLLDELRQLRAENIRRKFDNGELSDSKGK